MTFWVRMHFSSSPMVQYRGGNVTSNSIMMHRDQVWFTAIVEDVTEYRH